MVANTPSETCLARHGPSPAAVEIVDPRRSPEWDDAVRSHRGASFFQSAAWASVLCEAYGYTPCYLTARRGNQIDALLPMMEVNSAWTGRRGVSLPFTDRCAPLLSDAVPYSCLFQSAIKLGKQRRWRYVELRDAGPAMKGARPSVSYVEHSIPLTNERENLARLKTEVRTAIRRAERSGVRVTMQDSLEALRAFYGLHCRTRRKHGLPPQPFSFFESIWRHALRRGMGAVFLACHDDRPVAGAVFAHFGKEAIYKYGASDARFQKLRGTNLIFWEAIKHFLREGYASLSLGRSGLRDAGLQQFKRGLGGEERKLEYLRYDLRTENFVSAEDTASGWHNAVFRRLPISVNRVLGTLLYRHTG